MPSIVCETTTNRGGSLRMSKGRRLLEATRTFLVEGESKGLTPFDIKFTTPGLPEPGVSTYETWAICKNVTADQREDNALFWDVTVEYSSEVDDDSTDGSGDSPGGSDPELWVPVRETFLETIEDFDIKAKGSPTRYFLNGMLMPLDTFPAQTRDLIRWEFFQIESPLITDEQISERNNTINDREYKTKEKHTLLLKVKSSKLGYYFGARRRLTEYTITWDPENWHSKYANVGTQFFDSTNNKTVDYNYTDARDTVQLGPLGTRDVSFEDQLDPAQDGVPIDNNAVNDAAEGREYATRLTTPKLYFIERQVFEEKNFSSFLRI